MRRRKSSVDETFIEEAIASMELPDDEILKQCIREELMGDDDPFDLDDDNCPHGVGFDEDCEDCEDENGGY